MQTARRDSAIPPTTFTCERCLMTFNTREELRNHNITVHSAAEARARMILRMPERRTVIVAAAITGGVLVAGLVLQYYLRKRRERMM
jgi:hypothetical protein